MLSQLPLQIKGRAHDELGLEVSTPVSNDENRLNDNN